MSYLVVVTFDIHSGSSEEYDAANDVLSEIGLEKNIVGSSGKSIKLPRNTYAGEFEGQNVGKIRDDLCNEIKESFESVGVKASIFVTVGGNWAWGKRNT